MPIKAVLFDFDGTLADSTELIMQCYRHTMTEHLGAPPPDEEWLRGFGTPLHGQIRRFARSDAQAEAMLESYRAFQEVHHDTLLKPFSGAVEVVSQLRENEVPMAIVTSKYRHGTLRGMDLCGLTDFIPEIITPEDVENPKPHPEPVELALKRLNVPAERAIFVGDSPHDMAAGRGAGTRTAGALWGPFPREALEAEQPDYMLESLDDVLALVRQGG